MVTLKTPKLRFKDESGKDFQDWKDTKLGIISSFKKGKGVSKEDTKQEGKNKCIRYGELFTDYGVLIDSIKSSTDIESEEMVLSEKNDLLMPTSDVTPYGLATASAINVKGVILGGDILILKSKKLNNLFLAYYIRSHKKDIMRLVTGVTVYHIYAKDLNSFDISYPESIEQKKIADFIFSIDTYIQNLKSEKEELGKYKKGMMQKIFSQEIRFKDVNGNSFPDWIKLKLDDFLNTTIRKVEKPKENYKSIGIRSHFKGTFQRIDNDPNTNSMETLYKVMADDLIVNITFAWEGAMALATEKDTGGYVSHRFPTYTFDLSKVTPHFFKYAFPTNRMKYTLKNISPGGAGRNRVLNKTDFLQINMSLPCLGEQSKIASFLDSISNELNNLTDRLKYLETWKKGLMQEMFL